MTPFIRSHFILAFVFYSIVHASVFSSAAQASTVPETPPSAWNPGSFSLQTHTEYFSSNANYSTSRGSYDHLQNNNKWTSFENRFKARFASDRNFSFFLGTGYTSSTATDFYREKNNAGLTEIFAGANFLLTRRWWRVVPEIEVSYPIQKTTYLQTNPLISDGVAYARAGLFLFKPYKYLRFESYLGFHFPGEGLAKRFMYQLATEIALFGAFTVGGGVQGYETIISDDTSYAERRMTSSSANGTSDRFWAYNPAVIEGRAWFGFRLDKSFNIRLGYLQTVTGIRAAQGNSFLLSLNYNSAGDRGRAGARESVTQKQPVPQNRRGFHTEPEMVDPELFDQRDSLDNAERLLETH